MSEKRDIFSKAAKPVANTGGGTSYGFPFSVDKYDVQNERIYGKCIMDGTPIVVTLRERDAEAVQKAKYQRPTVAEFAMYDVRGKPPAVATEPGGIMMMDSPREAGTIDGIRHITSSWINVLSHYPGEAAVVPEAVIGVHMRDNWARLSILPTLAMNDEDYAALNVPAPAIHTGMESLRESMIATLKTGATVGIRAISSNGNFDASYLGVRSQEERADPAGIVDEWLKNIEDLAPQMSEGLRIETIPVASYFVGKETFAASRTQRLLKGFSISEAGDRFRGGYATGVVALMKHKTDGQFVNYVSRTGDFIAQNLEDAIGYAQTENLSPVPPKLDQPARQGGDEHSFDASDYSVSAAAESSRAPESQDQRAPAAAEQQQAAPAQEPAQRPRARPGR